MANKLIIIPEQIYRGLTSVRDTGDDSLDFTRRQIEKIKNEKIDPSRKNVKYNQELRRYLTIKNEKENMPIRVEVTKGAKMVMKKGDEEEEEIILPDEPDTLPAKKSRPEMSKKPNRPNLTRAKGIIPEKRRGPGRAKSPPIPNEPIEPSTLPPNPDEVFVPGMDEDQPSASIVIQPPTISQPPSIEIPSFPPKIWGGPVRSKGASDLRSPAAGRNKRIQKKPYPKKKPKAIAEDDEPQSRPIIEELVEDAPLPQIMPPQPKFSIAPQPERPMELDFPLVNRPNYRKKGYDPNLMEFLTPGMRYERLKRKATDFDEHMESKKARFHDPILALPAPPRRGQKRKLLDIPESSKKPKLSLPSSTKKAIKGKRRRKAIKGKTPIKAILGKFPIKAIEDKPQLKAIEDRPQSSNLLSPAASGPRIHNNRIKAIEGKPSLLAIMPPPRKGTKRKQVDEGYTVTKKIKWAERKPTRIDTLKWAQRKPTKFDTKKWASRKPTLRELL